MFSCISLIFFLPKDGTRTLTGQGYQSSPLLYHIPALFCPQGNESADNCKLAIICCNMTVPAHQGHVSPFPERCGKPAELPPLALQSQCRKSSAQHQQKHNLGEAQHWVPLYTGTGCALYTTSTT